MKKKKKVKTTNAQSTSSTTRDPARGTTKKTLKIKGVTGDWILWGHRNGMGGRVCKLEGFRTHKNQPEWENF